MDEEKLEIERRLKEEQMKAKEQRIEEIKNSPLEKEIAELRSKLKDKYQQRVHTRPDYLVPPTKFAEADLVVKLITVGAGIGVQLNRDLVHGMNLKKGQMLKAHIRLFPEDAMKLQ